MDKKARAEAKEDFEFSESLQETSEESFNKDLEMQERYKQSDDAQNIFEYKVLRLIPNANNKHPDLIDKDVVLANLKESKPDAKELKFIAETITALKSILVTKQTVYYANEKGERITEKTKDGKVVYKSEEQTVFDETFRPVIEFLETGFKYEHVASRAMGEERESKLDRSSFIGKEVKKMPKEIKNYN